MSNNLGGIDRALRIIIGLALIVAAVTGTLGVWAYIGVIPLATGLVGWCGLYKVFGFNTKSKS